MQQPPQQAGIIRLPERFFFLKVALRWRHFASSSVSGYRRCTDAVPTLCRLCADSVPTLVTT